MGCCLEYENAFEQVMDFVGGVMLSRWFGGAGILCIDLLHHVMLSRRRRRSILHMWLAAMVKRFDMHNADTACWPAWCARCFGGLAPSA